MSNAIRKHDGMDVYRAHLALSQAANYALVQHYKHDGDFYLRQCKENFVEAAVYLGFEVSEIVSTADRNHEGSRIEAAVLVS